MNEKPFQYIMYNQHWYSFEDDIRKKDRGIQLDTWA